MSNRPRLVLLALLPTLMACGGSVAVAHRSVVPHGAHVYRSYAVVDHPVNRGELDDLVEESLHTLMGSHGYERVAPEAADLHVSYGVLLSATVDSEGTETVVSDLDGELDSAPRTKTIVVLLQERDSRAVVWVGVSSASGIDAELRERAPEAIEAMGTRMPPANRPAE